jgi:hypothetical protein
MQSLKPARTCPKFKLRYVKYKVAEPDHGSSMTTLFFLCPSTGAWVQAWFADNRSEDDGETYEQVTCRACMRLHMVNPRNGKVLGTMESNVQSVPSWHTSG